MKKDGSFALQRQKTYMTHFLLKIVCTPIPTKKNNPDLYLSFQPFLLQRLAQLLLYIDSLSS